uniref:Uncharacterized protein n=3 Tax=Treponema pallidum TaxID=160 RepID=E5FNT2_TREPE|nr:hypothetical protein [Treponema pallidum subsp. pertenue]ADR64352.1 hypothetical protein [Treponema pallidum subsp. pertenue str. Gauthier]ADR64437.1 hypothetical protein [Treponema pallidum str. Fribourg-Blanc]
MAGGRACSDEERKHPVTRGSRSTRWFLPARAAPVFDLPSPSGWNCVFCARLSMLEVSGATIFGCNAPRAGAHGAIDVRCILFLMPHV